MQIDPPFDPLNKLNLGRSVADAMLEKKVTPLGELAPFEGAGIYAIYYVGEFPAYEPIRRANLDDKFEQPIYVGKATPKGSRRGGLGFDAKVGTVLYKRLQEHGKSIEQVANLDIKDFYCRYLIVEDIWIPLGESLLINMFEPIWNMRVDGFGNHDPGSGRKEQKASPWDTLHPGRPWVTALNIGKEREKILMEVSAFFERNKKV